MVSRCLKGQTGLFSLDEATNLGEGKTLNSKIRLGESVVLRCPSLLLLAYSKRMATLTQGFAIIDIMKKFKPHTLTIVIYKALCFDVAQGRMNWAPNENRTHSCRFASLAC